ncbi:phosphoribosylamine--glycine ligase [Paenibacillus larvae]
MRVLMIGRGGREHALLWSLSKSPKITKLFCAPGNGGIASLAECVPIEEMEFARIAEFSQQEKIDLVFVSPDDSLVGGLVDYLEERGVRAYGPDRRAALIEGSKAFTKDLMHKYGIPTAAYRTFEDAEEALSYVRTQPLPIVVKADGLAAGKGVIVARTREEAEQAIRHMMIDGAFGQSGSQVVIEEFLEGEEMSLLAFVDGSTVRPMVPSQDHKPVFDGNRGPNTGGMGTYSPVPHIPESAVDEAVRNILQPAADAMVKEGRPFRGVLYAGLIVTEQGVKTIEFNARFGDPETQVILTRLETDLLDIIEATLEGRLVDVEIRWSKQSAVCVILASEGYPGSYPKGRIISGADKVQETLVFHAGTALQAGHLVTGGGRVLGITALGDSMEEARKNAYRQAGYISFEGMHYRTDIAKKACEVIASRAE